jgi:hypothetical protein
VPSDACIPSVEDRAYNNVHLFCTMPLNPLFSSFCVHLRFLITGSLRGNVWGVCDKTCGLLKQPSIYVRGIATDGDRASLPGEYSRSALDQHCPDGHMTNIAALVSDRVWKMLIPFWSRPNRRHDLAAYTP